MPACTRARAAASRARAACSVVRSIVRPARARPCNVGHQAFDRSPRFGLNRALVGSSRYMYICRPQFSKSNTKRDTVTSTPWDYGSSYRDNLNSQEANKWAGPEKRGKQTSRAQAWPLKWDRQREDKSGGAIKDRYVMKLNIYLYSSHRIVITILRSYIDWIALILVMVLTGQNLNIIRNEAMHSSEKVLE